MGIKDLLRFMKPYIQPIHIKKYAGKRVGIDAYSWLHKGAYSCSMELCLDSKSETKLRYIDYFMHRINLLRFHKITPIVVFDGGSIPCKSATVHERQRKRKANRESAMAKLEEGDVNAATELFQRAVNVTPSMAHQLIQILRSENIEFVVAPYEADAQLAYLSSIEADKGGIAAVITEDSDLMAYGCQAIVFKMDRFGNGQEILLHNVFDSVTCSPSFRHFDKELFIGMCVLAGCDFLPSVPGIGIAKAYSLVSKYRNLDRVLSVLKSRQMPEDYSKSFKEALAVFQHARIYDAETKMIKHMKPLSQQLLQSLDGELDFLGPEIPASLASAIAEGKLDPTNMEAFDCSSSPERCPYPFVTETCGVQKNKTAAASRRNRSNIVSSSPTVENNITGQVQKQEWISTESKYLNEDVALEKLIMLSESHGKVETMTTPHNISLKTPNNNPFKKKKADVCKLEEELSSAEEISLLTGNEDQEILCIAHDEILSKIHFNHSKRKRKHKEIHLDHSDSNGLQLSVVTEEENLERVKVENTDVLCGTTESQESVNSKPKRMSDDKPAKNQKSKRSNPNGSEKKKNSILNFFSPL
ncbi:exonuclease 1 [Tripterygium wilfordii]|uniref:exonuclease 1 n=1 Tax=Tripterygium wilfordii TaxID=458696 RepID=UPI0018F80D06|nr:exonuclease 1 [Tripterygium wilfordii]